MFAAGIASAASGKWQFLLIGPLVLAILAFEIHKMCRPRAILVWALVLGIALGTGFWHYHAKDLHRKEYLTQMTEGEMVWLKGILSKKEIRSSSYRYYLENVLLRKGEDTFFCNSVIFYTDADTCSIGDTLLLQGKLNLFSQSRNDGQFDQSSFYHAQKIDFEIRPQRVEVIEEATYPWKEWLFRLQKKFSSVLWQTDIETAGTLSSMIWGEKSGMDSDLQELYRDAGIAHILAISSMHITMIGMTLFELLRRCGGGYGASSVIAGIVILAYGILTGLSISTCRALLMFLLVLTGNLLGRRSDTLNSMGMVVLWLLWQNPFLIAYSGFLFSVTAVLGVTVTGKAFGGERLDLYDRSPLVRQLGGWLLRNLERSWTGLAVTLTTLPLVAWYYFEIPVYASFLNLLVLPALGIVLGSAILTSLVGALFPALLASGFCRYLLLPAIWILRAYQRLCLLATSRPGAAYICGKPALWQCALYYLLLLAGIFFLMRKQKEKRKASVLLFGGRRLLLVLLCLGILFYRPEEGFSMTFLDVGQGDGICIRTESRQTMMIDGGSTSDSKIGAHVILPYLKCHGVREVDYWFVSHADQDHIRGLQTVLEEGGPRICKLLLPDKMPRDEAWEELTEAAEMAGVPILYLNPGDEIRSGQERILCLGPGSEMETAFSERNDLSLVLYYQNSWTSALFPGDLSAAAERKLAAGGIPQTEILKVCHHGSRYSSDADFLKMVSPKLAIISCSEKNSFGHPAPEAIERLEEAGAVLRYTMKEGQITLK